MAASRRSSSSSAAARPASPPPWRRRAQRLASRCSSAIPTSAAWPPAAWCWCSTTCATAHEITVRGICLEMIERMAALGLAVTRRQDRNALRPETVARGRAGAPSTSTRTRSRSRSATPPRSTPTAASASPTTWSREAGVKLRLHSLVLAAPSSRTAHQGRGLRDQGGPRGHPRRRGHRHHRRPRRRRLGRRAVHQGQLHHHDRVPPRRRRHRRSRAVRARGTRGLPRDRPRDQAAARRLPGSTGG